MCSFMLICQYCFAIVKVLFKKVTYLLTSVSSVCKEVSTAQNSYNLCSIVQTISTAQVLSVEH